MFIYIHIYNVQYLCSVLYRVMRRKQSDIGVPEILCLGLKITGKVVYLRI